MPRTAPKLGGGSLKLDAAAFESRFNMPLVHEAVRAELNARRRGTASTLTVPWPGPWAIVTVVASTVPSASVSLASTGIVTAWLALVVPMNMATAATAQRCWPK